MRGSYQSAIPVYIMSDICKVAQLSRLFCVCPSGAVSDVSEQQQQKYRITAAPNARSSAVCS